MKKRLLISWGNPYIFYESIIILIPELAKNFSISIILTNTVIPKETFKLLETMKVEKLIERYWILPKQKYMFSYHLFIRSRLKIWKAYNYDLFLSTSGILIVEQYLLNCALPIHCVHVCFWAITSYILRNRDLVRKLSKDKNFEQFLISEKIEQSRQYDFFYKFLRKIKKTGSLSVILKIIFQRTKAYINSIFIKKIREYADRILLPMLLVKKTFPLSENDRLSQIAIDKTDVFIFCEQLEAEMFTALFKKTNLYLAKYPTQGRCRCSGMRHNKNTVLVPLSVDLGEEEDFLNFFYRDIKIVLSESGAKTVHLRLHPRTDVFRRWPYQLLEYLRGKGIDAHIVDSQRPIREIMCDYLGMAGCISNSLRDGRASCDYAFIIGFVSVSKKLTQNPKLLFSSLEGISWIEEDGSYDPAVFKRYKYSPAERKSIDEILVEIKDKEKYVFN